MKRYLIIILFLMPLFGITQTKNVNSSGSNLVNISDDQIINGTKLFTTPPLQPTGAQIIADSDTIPNAGDVFAAIAATSGTVTSAGFNDGTGFTISGSPITGSSSFTFIQDFSEFTDITESTGIKFVVTDPAEKEIAITDVDLSDFNNDAGFITGNESITLSGDVSGSGATAITTTIGADKILESMLKSVNAPTDEYILTYESTTGDFEWKASGMTTAEGSLTSTQVNNLGTFHSLISAPGSGKFLKIFGCTIRTRVTTQLEAGTQNLDFKYNSFGGTWGSLANGSLEGPSVFKDIMHFITATSSNISINTPFGLQLSSNTNPTAGNVSIDYKVFYTIEDE